LYHIPLEGKALDAGELARLRSFVQELVGRLVSLRGVKPQYFVQVARLQKPPWRDLLYQNARFWSVNTGLGIRPGRPLPAPLTLVDVLSLKRPVMPEVVYQVNPDEHVHLFHPRQEIPSATNTYLGSGGCVVFLVTDAAGFLLQAKKTFAAGLDPALAAFDFCVPLLSLKDFTSASVETIQAWFRLFDVYIAEIQDEPGILVASREPITQLLAELQHFLDGGYGNS
jgi:hypothetical protein